MRKDIKLLMDCDCILMLKGWSVSRGASIERELAMSLGLPIFYEDLLDQGHYDDEQIVRHPAGHLERMRLRGNE